MSLRWPRAPARQLVTGFILPSCILLGLDACRRAPRENDAEVVMRWLTCEECTSGERSMVVDTLGDRAIPLLTEALIDLSDRYLENLSHQLRNEWSLLSQPTLDLPDYIDYYTRNARTSIQRRAAVALGDLGEVGVLQDALEDGRADLIELGPEVQVTIESILDRLGAAPGFGPPASLEIEPRSLELGPGSTALLGAVVKDADGNRLYSTPVSWSSTDAGVASVATVATQRGEVSASAPGTAEIVAVVSPSLGDQVPITVDTAPADTLRKTSSVETVAVGETTADSLEVEAAGPGGVSAGVSVRWQIVVGDAVFAATRTRTYVQPTDSSGRSWAYVLAGPTAGTVQVRASIPSDSESFRFTVTN